MENSQHNKERGSQIASYHIFAENISYEETGDITYYIDAGGMW